MKSGNKGFTLVELSIVIVIVGLIIAGVTAGQALVKQAQLRSILTQADQVRAAVNSFKLQYAGLPGDVTNGSSYWTTGCLGTGAAASASVDNDCNGNGDKQISILAKSTVTFSKEAYIAWLQLSKANLFPGSFVPGNVNPTVGALNTNIPAAKYSGAGISLGYGSANILTSTAGAGTAKNLIVFGATATTVANGAFLTPAQAYALDAKADDGHAFKGSLLGGFTNAGVLTTCASDVTGVYALSTTTATCSLGFAL